MSTVPPLISLTQPTGCRGGVGQYGYYIFDHPRQVSLFLPPSLFLSLSPSSFHLPPPFSTSSPFSLPLSPPLSPSFPLPLSLSLPPSLSLLPIPSLSSPSLSLTPNTHPPHTCTYTHSAIAVRAHTYFRLTYLYVSGYKLTINYNPEPNQNLCQISKLPTI